MYINLNHMMHNTKNKSRNASLRVDFPRGNPSRCAAKPHGSWKTSPISRNRCIVTLAEYAGCVSVFVCVVGFACVLMCVQSGFAFVQIGCFLFALFA